MSFETKRIYDDPSDADGIRILVDRLWPRGISKEKAQLAEWCRDLAPSDELRKEFHKNTERWEEFCEAYAAELEGMSEEIERIREMGRSRTVTLLYALKNEEHNNAVALKQYLEQD